jgi:hypothetical protein
MSENKNLVQEALIQMKNVEDVIAENAKGILASTMKEEISQLVKESLNEQEDEEIELDAEFDTDEVEDDADNLEDMDSEESEDEMEFGDEDEMEFEDDEETIDLTNASAEDILTIFKRMSDEDGIIVQKDGDEISIKDSGDDVEYLVKMNEQEEDEELDEQYDEEEDYFGFDGIGEEDEMMEQDVEDSDLDAVLDALYNEQEDMDEEDEVVYEIVMDEEDMDMSEMDDMEMSEMDDMDMSEMYEEDEDNEGYNLEEAKMTVKPKGVGMGNPKFKYGSSLPKKGFSDDKKEGPKTMGTGKAKFEFKEGQGYDDKEDEREGMKHGKIAKKDLKSTKSRRDDAHFETRKKKEETKEAARTYAMGSKEGRGLRKGITNNRNYTYESVETEMNVLREKNEEYRKALNVFREKLNEVAVFNSNLAYATRLFTEHSTTKKEKINILRRFDSVESLKESKQLYKTVKDELSKVEGKSINESVETKLNNQMSSGSSTSLIESKTYENPQFLRIKDLMAKM